MTTQVLKFVELSERDRRQTGPMRKLEKDDRVELRVMRKDGGDQTVSLLEDVLGHLLRGERIAVLAEDQELSPNDAASILGLSRPSVVHRMDVGDLPFHYVGKHRRARLKDVLALKSKVDVQQVALNALAQDTEALMRDYGL